MIWSFLFFYNNLLIRNVPRSVQEELCSFLLYTMIWLVIKIDNKLQKVAGVLSTPKVLWASHHLWCSQGLKSRRDSFIKKPERESYERQARGFII